MPPGGGKHGKLLTAALAALLVFSALPLLGGAQGVDAADPMAGLKTKSHEVNALNPKPLTVTYGDRITLWHTSGNSESWSADGFELIGTWKVSISTGGWTHYREYRAVSAGDKNISLTLSTPGWKLLGHWILQPTSSTHVQEVKVLPYKVECTNLAELANMPAPRVGEPWAWVPVPTVYPHGGWKVANDPVHNKPSVMNSDADRKTTLSIARVENHDTLIRLAPVSKNYTGSIEFRINPFNPTAVVEFVNEAVTATVGIPWETMFQTEGYVKLSKVNLDVVSGDKGNIEFLAANLDGATAYKGVMSATFTAPGPYKLKLTATPQAADMHPGIKEIVVNVVPNEAVAGEIVKGQILAYERTGYHGLYDFVARGFSNYKMVEWDFGDGSPKVTNTLTPFHNYDMSGAHTATVTFSNDTDVLAVSVPVNFLDTGEPVGKVFLDDSYSYSVQVPVGPVITVTAPPWLTHKETLTASGSRILSITGPATQLSAPGEPFTCQIMVGSNVFREWTIEVVPKDGEIIPVAMFDYDVDGLRVTVTSKSKYATMVMYVVRDALGNNVNSYASEPGGVTVMDMPSDGTYQITQMATRIGDSALTATHDVMLTVKSVDDGGGSDGGGNDGNGGEGVLPPVPPPEYMDITVAFFACLMASVVVGASWRIGRIGTAAATLIILLFLAVTTYLVAIGAIGGVPWAEWKGMIK